jgi:DNA (cytosine-5)-methyltransferase 1
MDKPAPTVLGSPDDSGHYFESEATQRTLTVRELARIQSFPDWYEIRSKVTTGGLRRKFEVPQYTQIGNAVPPLLGLALGKVCLDILEAANHIE